MSLLPQRIQACRKLFQERSRAHIQQARKRANSISMSLHTDSEQTPKTTWTSQIKGREAKAYGRQDSYQQLIKLAYPQNEKTLEKIAVQRPASAYKVGALTKVLIKQKQTPNGFYSTEAEATLARTPLAEQLNRKTFVVQHKQIKKRNLQQLSRKQSESVIMQQNKVRREQNGSGRERESLLSNLQKMQERIHNLVTNLRL